MRKGFDREEAVLASVAPGQQFEPGISEHLLEATSKLVRTWWSWAISVISPGAVRTRMGRTTMPIPVVVIPAASICPGSNLPDEVAFVALAAAGVETNLCPPLGLFLEGAAPGFENLAKRRARRSERRVANDDGPVGGRVRAGATRQKKSGGGERDHQRVLPTAHSGSPYYKPSAGTNRRRRNSRSSSSVRRGSGAASRERIIRSMNSMLSAASLFVPTGGLDDLGQGDACERDRRGLCEAVQNSRVEHGRLPNLPKDWVLRDRPKGEQRSRRRSSRPAPQTPECALEPRWPGGALPEATRSESSSSRSLK